MLMAKRERDESRQVAVGGFRRDATADRIAGVFGRCGKIDFIQLGDGNCVVQFEGAESVDRALELHNTKQLKLCASLLSVVPLDVNPTKRARVSLGSYAVLDPPRFNNRLIPVLPSFFNH